MSQIVDGYTGKPNIYADVIGEHNISMYGAGDYVLQVGECLGYELISNNEIHVKDGMFITQGRRGYIKKGTTDICVIENGAQAVNRNDLIVIEYAKDQSSQVERHTTKVIKGTPGKTATDPDVITGDIPNGAILHQMPLYRVKIEGLNIVAVEQLFEFGSVAAETVDPMLATKEGFAADALKVKQALNAKNATLLWSGTAKNGSSATLNKSIENFNWIVLIAKQNNSMMIYSIPVLALTLQETDSSNFLTHCLSEDNSISVFKGYTNNILTFWMTNSITLQKIYGC